MRMVTLRNGQSVPEKSFNKVVDALERVVDKCPYGASILMDISIGFKGGSLARSFFYDDLYGLGLINKRGYMPATVREICGNAFYNQNGLELHSPQNMLQPTRNSDIIRSNAPIGLIRG